MTESAQLTGWLTDFIGRNGGVAGTVHVTRGDELVLSAWHNIPPPVRELSAVVPNGKGMAGLAMQREQPVQTCNVQTDDSGDVRPGARSVGAQAAVALPVHDPAGAVRAVVGIAFLGERELPQDEVERLRDDATSLPA